MAAETARCCEHLGMTSDIVDIEETGEEGLLPYVHVIDREERVDSLAETLESRISVASNGKQDTSLLCSSVAGARQSASGHVTMSPQGLMAVHERLHL
jgi:hypothetical protein